MQPMRPVNTCDKFVTIKIIIQYFANGISFWFIDFFSPSTETILENLLK